MTLFREGFSGEAFLLCVAAGFLSAAVCDVIHVICRLFAKGKIALAAADIVSCLTVAAVACIVSLPVSFGQIRFFQVLAELLGGAVYALSFGVLMKRIISVAERIAFSLEKQWVKACVFLQKKQLCSNRGQKQVQKSRRRKKIGKT